MSNEQMSLGDILGDAKPEPAAPPPATEPAAPAAETTAEPAAPPVERPQSRRKQWADKEQLAQGRVRDPETGQFLKADEKPADPEKAAAAEPAKPELKTEPAKAAEPAKTTSPQQEFTEKEKAFLRAAQEERQKRQQLEVRLKELEAAKPAEPAKTFWDDPEAALKAHEERIKQESTNARLQMAEFNARQRHPDFDEKIAAFSELVQQTPGLANQWLASPDPGEFAYRVGKNHKELQEAGGIEELRAKIERETTARVRAEVETELRAKADSLAKDRAAIPPTLSDARSTGAQNRPVWSGPTPLDSILGKG